MSLKSNPDTHRAWQQRTRDKAIQRRIAKVNGSAYNRQFPNGVAKPKKPLKKASQSLRRQQRIYYASFAEWVQKPDNAQCAICVVLFAAGEIPGIRLTTERHHARGRHHKLLNWEPGWVPCCRLHRSWPHAPENRQRAEEHGIMSSVSDFNTYPEELRNA